MTFGNGSLLKGFSADLVLKNELSTTVLDVMFLHP